MPLAAMLDVPTLYTILIGMVVVQSVAWLLVLRSEQRMPGAWHWSLGFMLLSVGLLALIMRGTWNDWISVVAANIVLILGQGLTVLGLAQILGRPQPHRLIWGAVAAAAIGWTYLYHFHPALVGARVILYSVLLVILFAGFARLCFAPSPLPTLPRRLLGAIFSLHAVAHAWRAAHTLLLAFGHELMDPVLLEGLVMLETILMLLGISSVYAALIYARLNLSIADRNRSLEVEIAMRQQAWINLTEASDHEADQRMRQQQFVALITREFREPLEQIEGAATSLSRLTTAAESVTIRLQAIMGAVRRLRTLIGMFLLDQRLPGSQSMLRREIVAVGHLLADLCSHHLAPESATRVQLRLPEREVLVAGDPAMLSVVFGNLIDNALKYSTADGPVTVMVSARARMADISITDQGIGIPPEDIDRVGQRFFRASNTAGLPGTGLGLYGAMHLVRFHGGDMRITSEPGQGTCILVELPLHTGWPAVSDPDDARDRAGAGGGGLPAASGAGAGGADAA